MKVGLVLSGGSGKGAYQIGALRAIEEMIDKKDIKYISCSSVGVLNGFAFSTNNLDGAEKMWKNINSSDTRVYLTQILRSTMLQNSIMKLCRNYREIKTNFYCSLTDVTNMNVEYKNLSEVSEKILPQYLKASVAIPIYNHSVNIGGISYYDGALIDNIPVFPLLEKELDYIICIYFDNICYSFENPFFDRKIIKISFFENDGFFQYSFKRENIDSMIDIGYKRTKYILNSVFSNGNTNLDYIYSAIENLNKDMKNKSTRITGDIILSNFNKLTKKLVKRRLT